MVIQPVDRCGIGVGERWGWKVVAMTRFICFLSFFFLYFIFQHSVSVHFCCGRQRVELKLTTNIEYETNIFIMS